MLYEVTIEEVYEVEGKDYPKKVEIYKQQIANVNIAETVKFLNRGETARVGSLERPDVHLYPPSTTDYCIGDDLNAPKTTC